MPLLSCHTHGYQSIPTSLETEGNPSSLPFATTTVTSPRTPYSTSGVVGTPAPSITNVTIAMAMPQVPMEAAGASVDLFQAIATTPPPSQITSRSDHPVPRLGVVSFLESHIYRDSADCRTGCSDKSCVHKQVLREPISGWPGTRSLDASVLNLLE